MIISCSHCHGENEKCPVCDGKRLALISFGQVFFWRQNLSIKDINARIFWRLTRQLLEGLILIFLILSIVIGFYLILFSPTANSGQNISARLGFVGLIAILYFFFRVHLFSQSKEKVAPVFLPTVISPEEEDEIWQKYSRFEKINCAGSFSGEVLNLIDRAALLARQKNQTFVPLHLFFLLVGQTEIKHYFERAGINLLGLKKRLAKSLESLPKGFGTGKEILELFLLAYLEAMESGEKVVGFSEILISFFTQKNLTADILGGFGLNLDDARNLSSWAAAQKNAALKIKHGRKNSVSVEKEAGLKETFKKIAARAPFLEKQNQVFFSYQALLEAAKIHENTFLNDSSLDKIFAILNSAARAVLRSAGEGKIVLAEDVKKASKGK